MCKNRTLEILRTETQSNFILRWLEFDLRVSRMTSSVSVLTLSSFCLPTINAQEATWRKHKGGSLSWTPSFISGVSHTKETISCVT